MENILQFAPFQSTIDIGFWFKLSEKKLNEFMLDDSPKDIHGYFTNTDIVGFGNSRLNIEYDALDVAKRLPPSAHRINGILFNTNTLEDFKNLDKRTLLKLEEDKLKSLIQRSKDVELDHISLNTFLAVVYADLKKYRFYYWFCFPSLKFPSVSVKEIQNYDECTTEHIRNKFIVEYDLFQSSESSNSPYFLLTFLDDNSLVLKPISAYHSIKRSETVFWIGFVDPSTSKNAPGWPLRNLIAYISHIWDPVDLENVRVLCFRSSFHCEVRKTSDSFLLTLSVVPFHVEKTVAVGWEKNIKGKLGPNTINLSSCMDPEKQAESAANLNLKLMRWRLVPEIDLDIISNTKCLLLGSGTLGCNVARCLLGWGVRNITFVDNSTISFSNPPRQSLFEFSDCLDGGRHKAECAADKMRKIFPKINAKGVKLSIPMPGHAVPDSCVESTLKDLDTLDNLIMNHDAIFLLMDSRESRWLPTVLGNVHRKIVIVSALGFDSYLAMRHGIDATTESSSLENHCKSPPASKLGCYFCNDIYSPSNSSVDRTLDQQCTVSRPGLSMIAAAISVELLISILQHPLGIMASATTSEKNLNLDCPLETCLGIVPHQVRGFLYRFQTILPVFYNFNSCTACSSYVLNGIKEDRDAFVLKVLNQPKYLEDLTGLTSLHLETLSDDMIAISDSDDDTGDESLIIHNKD